MSHGIKRLTSTYRYPFEVVSIRTIRVKQGQNGDERQRQPCQRDPQVQINQVNAGTCQLHVVKISRVFQTMSNHSITPR